MMVGIFGAVMGATGSIVFALANGRMTDVAGRAQYCHLFTVDGLNASALPHQCRDIERQIAQAGLYYILPLLLIGFGQFLNGSFVEISGTRLICRAQRMVFLAIMRQDSSYFDDQKVGEITSLLSTNVGMMRAGLTTALANCVKGLFQTVLGMFFMLRGIGGSPGSSKLFGSVVGCGMPAILAIFVLMKYRFEQISRNTSTCLTSVHYLLLGQEPTSRKRRPRKRKNPTASPQRCFLASKH